MPSKAPKRIPTQIDGASIFFSDSKFGEATPFYSKIINTTPTLTVRARLGVLFEPTFSLSPPTEFSELVCLSGTIQALIVDLRKDSPTEGDWQTFYCSQENSKSIEFEAGLAVGWQVLSPEAEIQLRNWDESRKRGCVRWDDPELSIDWELSPVEIAAWSRTHRTSRLGANWLDLPAFALPKHPHTISKQMTQIEFPDHSSDTVDTGPDSTLTDLTEYRTNRRTRRNQTPHDDWPVEQPTSPHSMSALTWESKPPREATDGDNSSQANLSAQAMHGPLAKGFSTLQNRELQKQVSPKTPTDATDPAGFHSSNSIFNSNHERRRILVLGCNSQLGNAFEQELTRDFDVVSTYLSKPRDRRVKNERIFLDASRPAFIRQILREIRPDIVINTASHRTLGSLSLRTRFSQLVNAIAPAILAEEALKINAALVHFCTALVFPSSGSRSWKESDAPLPRNQFAQSKLLGTLAVQNSGVPHLIIRTGWLYSHHHPNFVTRLCESLGYRPRLELDATRIGTPTNAQWLCENVANCLRSAGSRGETLDWFEQFGGLYHLVPSGWASRFDVGRFILNQMLKNDIPVATHSLIEAPNSPAQGPDSESHNLCFTNERLDSSAFVEKFNISLPAWQHQLETSLEAIGHRLSRHLKHRAA